MLSKALKTLLYSTSSTFCQNSCAVLPQLNLAACSINFFESYAVAKASFMHCANACASPVGKNKALPSPISRRLELSAVMTAVPHAKASIIGNPKPSYSDG